MKLATLTWPTDASLHGTSLSKNTRARHSFQCFAQRFPPKTEQTLLSHKFLFLCIYCLEKKDALDENTFFVGACGELNRISHQRVRGFTQHLCSFRGRMSLKNSFFNDGGELLRWRPNRPREIMGRLEDEK